ncbi:MAG: hydroxymethylbilane synthase [Anaerolineales bacterium]|nr:MAG: hydroxymethylbilane synthase [Anaerolineales bacterium]
MSPQCFQTITVGSRGSDLALWQTHWVIARLQQARPDIEFRIQRITTRGDVVRDRALSQVGGKGLFVKEIEAALLAGEIDLAVHSLKDMPTEQPEGLTISAVTAREDPRDVLVSRLGLKLAKLPQGARVGTSSLRRAAQLRASRPDLQIVDLRGNVDTRLRKATTEEYDAVVLAAAGVIRLRYSDRITEYLSPKVMLPAAGQGALCVEVRTDDEATRTLISIVHDPLTDAAVMAERVFLTRMGGGCQVPIAAYGIVNADELWLRGLVASPDGSRLLRHELRGSWTEPVVLGQALAEEMLAQGADEICRER